MAAYSIEMSMKGSLNVLVVVYLDGKKDGSVDRYRKGVPAKLLWYFPPIPRFKRMFQSSQIAKDLTWHANERVHDGKLQHPADSPL